MHSDGLCLVFVCQAGALETKAVLLAASLRRHLSPEHELIAAVPQPEKHWGRLSPLTLDTLKRHSVRVAPIVNRVSLGFPIANKIDCLQIPTDRAKIAFLDSDMLLLRDVDLAPLRDVALGAVPASFTPARPIDWARCYDVCGLSPPKPSMRTLISDELTVPYFNSGFVLTDSINAPALAKEWVHCALRILELDGLPDVLQKRFLDQVALPIAAARLGIAITALKPEWNFPSWSMMIGPGPVPAFFHYQDLSRLMSGKVTEEALFALIEADHGVAQSVISAVRATE